MNLIINLLKLTVLNFYVLVGFLPFIVFLQNFPTIISGFYIYQTEITKFSNAPEPMGKNYNTCYIIVEFKDKNGKRAVSSERCEYFDIENDINKKITVRINNEPNFQWFFPLMKQGNRFYNSVLSIENKQINSKYNIPLFIFSLSLIGLIMFILWLKNSLIPRIRGTHPLQIAYKNRKSESQSQFNYDKYN